MALELAVICVVAGVLLGLRFKVLILVPAIAFAMIFAVLVGVARADGAWSVAVSTVALAIAIQMGYLAGIAIRAAVEWIGALSARSRNPQLNPLGPVWPHMWPLNSWVAPGAPGAMARLRQPPPPQV